MSNDVVLNSIKDAIHKQDPSALVFLFGSRARGDNRPDSDWDILILINNQSITNEIEDNFRNVLYDIELETGQIISTFIYPKSYWNKKLRFSPLYESVKTEGIKL